MNARNHPDTASTRQASPTKDVRAPGEKPPGGAGGAVDPTKQVLRLPVTLSVHLASRRMELKQLLALTPGSLITFTKPCDELLDLYVNNHRYARGEAVKVGEKFGLKIDEIGPADE